MTEEERRALVETWPESLQKEHNERKALFQKWTETEEYRKSPFRALIRKCRAAARLADDPRTPEGERKAAEAAFDRLLKLYRPLNAEENRRMEAAIGPGGWLRV